MTAGQAMELLGISLKKLQAVQDLFEEVIVENWRCKDYIRTMEPDTQVSQAVIDFVKQDPIMGWSINFRLPIEEAPVDSPRESS